MKWQLHCSAVIIIFGIWQEVFSKFFHNGGRMVYCDAHFHMVQSNGCALSSNGDQFFGCTCAHGIKEFEAQQLLLEKNNVLSKKTYLSEGSACFDKTVLCASFGIHPQLCVEHGASIESYAAFMEQALASGKSDAIGEAGFDFFTEAYRSQKQWQEEAWRVQCELAVRYQVPLIVHNRKALDNMFRDASVLSKMKAVVFHSFAFGPREALSLLEHHIPAFFSFGKQLMNGNKKSISCVAALPQEVLLLETDAPYQTLKGETETKPEEIVNVYHAASKIRNCEEEKLSTLIEKNFSAVFLE